MKTILLTGGAGYIGSSTAAALRAAGFLPVVLDDLSTGHADNVRWGPLERADLADRDAVRDVLARHRPEAIIHFGASAYVGESVLDPERYYRNNVQGMLSLLSAAREARVERLVFSSSCATYGVPESLPIAETSRQDPINPYGRTKLVGEWMLQDFAAAYGLRYVALRYFNAAGADVENGLTERHDPETHLIPRVLMAAAGRIPVMEVFGDDYPTPDGTCVRDYIHVRDLADAHVAALCHLLDGGDSVALNLGTGNGTSIRQILATVEQVFGVKVPVVYKPRRAGDPAELVADPSRARAVIGFVAGRSDIRTIVGSAGPGFGLSTSGGS